MANVMLICSPDDYAKCFVTILGRGKDYIPTGHEITRFSTMAEWLEYSATANLDKKEAVDAVIIVDYELVASQPKERQQETKFERDSRRFGSAIGFIGPAAFAYEVRTGFFDSRKAQPSIYLITTKDLSDEYNQNNVGYRNAADNAQAEIVGWDCDLREAIKNTAALRKVGTDSLPKIGQRVGV